MPMVAIAPPARIVQEWLRPRGGGGNTTARLQSEARGRPAGRHGRRAPRPAGRGRAAARRRPARRGLRGDAPRGPLLRAAAPPAGPRHLGLEHRLPEERDFGGLSIGKQEFTVVFDTGSAHLIVPSLPQGCLSDTCRAHRQYDPAASSHALEIDHDGSRVLPGAPRDQISIAFGTGEVTGVFAQDRMCLGVVEPTEDTETAAYCVDMRIVHATEMSPEPFNSFTFDGILGLSLDSLALAPEFSVFGMMVREGRLARPSFGVFLAEGDEETSEISFGGHDPAKVRGEPAFVPVFGPEHGHWQVQITALRLGNQTLDFCSDGQCRAVVDSGTSLLAVPQALENDLAVMLEDSLRDPLEAGPDGSGVDCRLAQGMPLHFDIDGFTITLEPGDYTRQALRMSEDGTTVPALVSREPSVGEDGAEPLARSCWPTLMPIDFPEPLGPKLFIWGEPVLRRYYTVYDWHTQSIGFGRAAHGGPPEGASAAPAAEASGAVAGPAARARGRRPLLVV
ncbi:unnamed protein product [Prorocentrum cordatum]|uniref:Peptidase A1 domain-containing protein n=1 Tax=Prorocentrum cordatum TaxID=2364126 RepID=A0ABN9T7C6_9DINO|nr:unnamed protein product [Polarella glacialis]